MREALDGIARGLSHADHRRQAEQEAEQRRQQEESRRQAELAQQAEVARQRRDAVKPQATGTAPSRSGKKKLPWVVHLLWVGLTVGVLGLWIGRSNARRAPPPVASAPPAAVPVPERAPEVGWVRVERGPAHAERPVVLWRRDPETGGLTEIPGERLELERGVYAFRWERDGFERQDVEITVTPGDVFVLRPAPWIERAP